MALTKVSGSVIDSLALNKQLITQTDGGTADTILEYINAQIADVQSNLDAIETIGEIPSNTARVEATSTGQVRLLTNGGTPRVIVTATGRTYLGDSTSPFTAATAASLNVFSNISTQVAAGIPVNSYIQGRAQGSPNTSSGFMISPGTTGDTFITASRSDFVTANGRIHLNSLASTSTGVSDVGNPGGPISIHWNTATLTFPNIPFAALSIGDNGYQGGTNIANGIGLGNNQAFISTTAIDGGYGRNMIISSSQSGLNGSQSTGAVRLSSVGFSQFTVNPIYDTVTTAAFTARASNYATCATQRASTSNDKDYLPWEALSPQSAGSGLPYGTILANTTQVDDRFFVLNRITDQGIISVTAPTKGQILTNLPTSTSQKNWANSTLKTPLLSLYAPPDAAPSSLINLRMDFDTQSRDPAAFTSSTTEDPHLYKLTPLYTYYRVLSTTFGGATAASYASQIDASSAMLNIPFPATFVGMPTSAIPGEVSRETSNEHRFMRYNTTTSRHEVYGVFARYAVPAFIRTASVGGGFNAASATAGGINILEHSFYYKTYVASMPWDTAAAQGNTTTINDNLGNIGRAALAESFSVLGGANYTGGTVVDTSGVIGLNGSGFEYFKYDPNNSTHQILLAALGIDPTTAATKSRRTFDRKYMLKSNGVTISDGAYNATGADYAEWFEWLDGNPDNEDRVGTTVVIESGKIRKAVDGELPFGVISAVPAVVGDSGELTYHSRWKKDPYGRVLERNVEYRKWTQNVVHEDGSVTEEVMQFPVNLITVANLAVPDDAETLTVSEPIPNPEYDAGLEYIPRSARREWTTVGLVGKLVVNVGEVLNPSWIKLEEVTPGHHKYLVK